MSIDAGIVDTLTISWLWQTITSPFKWNCW